MSKSQSIVLADNHGDGEFNLDCIAFRSPSSNRWVGECEALGIVVEATDLNTLNQRFAEAICLLLTDLAETGDMDEFLEMKGWKKEEKEALSEYDPVNIPWNLIARNNKHGSKQAFA